MDARPISVRLAALVVVATVPLLPACGSAPRSTPTTTHAATVHVRQEWAGDGLYVEGSYSYVRVEQKDDAVAQVRLNDEKNPRATIRLDPGSYRFVSFQRPCDGNCGTLDPPTDKCSRAVELAPDAVVHTVVRLSPGEGCTFEEERPID